MNSIHDAVSARLGRQDEDYVQYRLEAIIQKQKEELELGSSSGKYGSALTFKKSDSDNVTNIDEDIEELNRDPDF